MTQFLLNECAGLARILGVSLGNAAIPSLLVCAVAYATMRRKAWNPASRYWTWWIVLAFVVLLPIAIFLWPPAAAPTPNPAPVISRAIVPETFVSLAAPAMPRREHWQAAASAGAIVFVLCGGAVLLQIIRLLAGLIASARLKRRAIASTDTTVMALFARAASSLQVRRKASVAISGDVNAPVAIGYRTPCILLPCKMMEQLEGGEIEQVLLHELAHIKRCDDWLIALQRIIEALFVFHPMVYFIGRRIDLEREMACDDQVTSSTPPRAYATCLTKIAELAQFEPAVAFTVPFLSRKSHLAARVEMILDRTRRHFPALSVRQLLVFGVFGILAACLTLRLPALIAFPAQQQTSDDTKKSSSAHDDPIGPIAVTSADGATTTFDHNGDEHNGHSPFPRGTIVFERNGDSFIIRDPATLAAVRDLMRPQEDLSRRQEALAAQQEKLAEEQSRLAEREEAVANRRLGKEQLDNLEKQLVNLNQKLHSIDIEKSAKTASDAQERLAELQALLADMQSSMGDEQAKVGEAQGKLGEQQGKLGEQQGLLGEQQGKLGEEQAREAAHAEQRLRELIRRAEAQGLAQPLH